MSIKIIKTSSRQRVNFNHVSNYDLTTDPYSVEKLRVTLYAPFVLPHNKSLHTHTLGVIIVNSREHGLRIIDAIDHFAMSKDALFLDLTQIP